MLHKQTSRPYAPMTMNDVLRIRAAGRTANDLKHIIKTSIKGRYKGEAQRAQRDLMKLREDILATFDIRL